MSLNGEQQGRIVYALLDAFPERGALQQLVMFKLDKDLNQIASGQTYSDIVYSLVRWAVAHGCVERLLVAASHEVPGNRVLESVVREFYHQSNSALLPLPSRSLNPFYGGRGLQPKKGLWVWMGSIASIAALYAIYSLYVGGGRHSPQSTHSRPLETEIQIPKSTATIYVGKGWQAVPLSFRPGDRLVVTASGKVRWGLAGDTSGPEGGTMSVGLYLSPPVPDEKRIGALIGQFEGEPEPFIIGERKVLVATSDKLLVAVNDAYPENNKGAYEVTIEVERP